MIEQRRAIDMCACCHKANQHIQGVNDCTVETCTCRSFIPHPQPVTGLDPGIEFLVHALRAVGYHTTDSGDGWSKDDPDALPYAHIFIVCEKQQLFEQTERINLFMRRHKEPSQVVGSYDPEGSCIIMVTWPGPLGKPNE